MKYILPFFTLGGFMFIILEAFLLNEIVGFLISGLVFLMFGCAVKSIMEEKRKEKK